jgi:hypothetical protein
MVFDNLSEKGWAHSDPISNDKPTENRGKTVENRGAQLLESPLFPVPAGSRVF